MEHRFSSLLNLTDHHENCDALLLRYRKPRCQALASVAYLLQLGASLQNPTHPETKTALDSNCLDTVKLDVDYYLAHHLHLPVFSSPIFNTALSPHQAIGSCRQFPTSPLVEANFVLASRELASGICLNSILCEQCFFHFPCFTSLLFESSKSSELSSSCYRSRSSGADTCEADH